MLLYYVRHGDPIYVPDSLTPLGKRQAEAVGKRLAMHGIDEIYSSTSVRAYETAVPLSEMVKKDITQLDYFCESEAGKYFGVTKEDGNRTWCYYVPEIKKQFISDEVRALGHNWYEYPEFSKYKFKEGVEFFNQKFDEFMLSLGYEHNRKTHTYKALEENNKNVAIFAHEGMGLAFLSSILDIPYAQLAAHYAMRTTGVTVIKFAQNGDEIIPIMLMFSNDSHIYKEGLPTSYCNTYFV